VIFLFWISDEVSWDFRSPWSVTCAVYKQPMEQNTVQQMAVTWSRTSDVAKHKTMELRSAHISGNLRV